MKPEIKAQWLAALRSGDYQQGRSLLHKDTGNTWESNGSVCNMYGQDGTLPLQVQEWGGLKHSDPMGLAGRNDDGATFEELAELIEENL